MRALLLVLLAAMPCWAQTTVYGEAVVDDGAGTYHVFSDVYEGLSLCIDPADTTRNTVSTSMGDITQIDDAVSGLSFTSGSFNDPADSTITTGDGRSVASILFDDANTEVLETATAFGTDGDYTAFLVWRTNDNTAAQTMFCIADTAVTNNYYFFTYLGATTDAISAPTHRDGGGSSGASPGSVTDTSLYIAFGTEESTSRIGKLDNGTPSTNSASRSASSLDTTALGAERRSSTSNYFSGDIVALYLYERTMTSGERDHIAHWLWRAKINADTALGGTK